MTRWVLGCLILVLFLTLAGCETRLGQRLVVSEPAEPLPRGPEFRAGAVQLGTSVRGEPIYVREHGRGAARLLVIGLIHGDEAEVYERFDDLWLRLATAGYGDRLTVAGIATMNPDGFAMGRRGNARGVDLNRNWPARNFRASTVHGADPLSEPEVAAVHRYIERFGPDAIVVFHSTAGGPFVDPDGPEPLSGVLAEAFVRGARAVDPSWRVHAEFTNPAGSMGTWFGGSVGRPILTVELRPGTPGSEALSAATAGLFGVMRAMSRGDQSLSAPPSVSRSNSSSGSPSSSL